MSNLHPGFADPKAQNPLKPRNSGAAGVCMMSSKWREEQPPRLIEFVSYFLNANSFRLNFVPIAPDIIFNCSGASVAFVFVTQWDCQHAVPIFSRVWNLKRKFANLYAVVSLPTKEQNESFVHSYFENRMEIGRPTFLPVQDLEMGFEKIVKIALARGSCKRNDVNSKMKAERKQAVQGMDLFLKVVTSIPGISNHDAIALNQTIGSIEAISKASKERILESTDLSADKAQTITRLFRDPEFYFRPKIN